MGGLWGEMVSLEKERLSSTPEARVKFSDLPVIT